jgi:hypothetical protein
MTVTTKTLDGAELPANVANKAMDVHFRFNNNGLTLEERQRILYAMDNNVTNKSFSAEFELADILVDMGTGAVPLTDLYLDKVEKISKQLVALSVMGEVVDHLENMYREQAAKLAGDDEEE